MITKQCTQTGAEPAERRTKQWRTAGVCVLLLGGVITGAVWWHGTRSPSIQDNPAMLGFNRAEHRQMGMFFGKSGYLIDDFLDNLKQPGTQAILIGVTTLIIATGCFIFARLPAPNPDHDIFKPSWPEKAGKP